MIGNEKVHQDVKFIELFQQIRRLEADLAWAREQIEGLVAAHSAKVNGRPVLSLRGK